MPVRVRVAVKVAVAKKKKAARLLSLTCQPLRVLLQCQMTTLCSRPLTLRL